MAPVTGFARGGGWGVSLRCHVRYAWTIARRGLPETGLGLIRGYGGAQRLPRIVGKGRAMEMILTGAHITAEEAMSIGLVNRVIPQAELLETVRKIAAGLAGKSAVTLRLALKAVNEGLNMTLDSACRLEAALFGVCGTTEDAKEGCRAFLEKRKPEFRDR